ASWPVHRPTTVRRLLPTRQSEGGRALRCTPFAARAGTRLQRGTWIGPYEREHDTLAHTLDDRRGVLLSSSFEFPGRYTRLDMGFVDPPLVFTARGRAFTIEALNARGRILIPDIAETLGGLAAADVSDFGKDHIRGEVSESGTRCPEEQRSRQPRADSALRALAVLVVLADSYELASNSGV